MTTSLRPTGLWILAGLVALVSIRVFEIVSVLSHAEPSAFAFSAGGDDGYYIFTVARSIALGLGISADGVTPTTGVQPLWTLLCVPAYWLGSTDAGSFAVIYALEVVLWLGSALLLARVVRDICIEAGTSVAPAALCVSMLLFLADQDIRGSAFNGLETSLYTNCLLLLVLWHRRFHLRPDTPPSWSRELAFGCLLGVTFLARNDAMFLCVTLSLLPLLRGIDAHSLRVVTTRAAAMAVIAGPWMLYCLLVSGGVVPQSGPAQALGINHVPFDAQKVVASCIMLAMYVLPSFLPGRAHWVPDTSYASFSGAPQLVTFFVFSATVLALLLRYLFSTPRLWATCRQTLLPWAVTLVPLVVYYVGWSGAMASFFRYFMPFKLLVFCLWSVALQQFLATSRRVPPIALYVVGAGCVVAALATNLRWTMLDARNARGLGHMGEEVLALAQSDLGRHSDAVIGMPESGRTGYRYPTRVVNLDGKMNLDVLKAMQDGTTLDYLLASNIDVLAMRPYHLAFFDRDVAGWREHFKPAGHIAGALVFTRPER